MSELSKQVRKQARELIRVAYMRELNDQLDKLSQKFDDWRKNTIDCWELDELIHKFHDETSRDLYKTYHHAQDNIFLIARALVHGFLQNDEIPKELLELSQAMISYLKTLESKANKDQ